jgi:G patch domain-containing protein 1
LDGQPLTSSRYFNSVGSKEGWTPSTFVSSRQNRAKKAEQKRPEDFMDADDLREQEESRQLQTADEFAGFGSTELDATRRAGLMDILKTGGETMGVKLLKKMGWREGQGIGPKVRRKANLDESSAPGGDAEETYLFAPENPPMVAFIRKNDRKGLGFEGESRLESHNALQPTRDVEESDSFFGGRLAIQGKAQPPKPKEPRRGGLGVGPLNDTGSDDEDPYSLGPQISYNKTIGGDKKKKKKVKPEPTIASANPLLNSKPVFISKKVAAARGAGGFRKCRDGRLPLDGFILADGIMGLSISEKKYDPPVIPEDWKPAKEISSEKRDQSKYVSTADAAKASTLNPTSRAALLGEDQLPGKSIFDYMSPEAREKIVKLTGNANLPPALGEKAPKGYELPESQKRKDLWDLVPKLDKQIAAQALARAVSGWMPYQEDEKKRARYQTFLQVSAGTRSTLPERVEGSSTDEWVMEMQEFSRAAEVFKPMSGVMASRFTSSSTAPKIVSDAPDPAESGLSRPVEKPDDPAVAAAKIGMFGPMTRSTISFYPSRLLCKRFNVKPPENVQLDPGERPGAPSTEPGTRFQSAGFQAETGPKQLVSQDVMNQLLIDSLGYLPTADGLDPSASGPVNAPPPVVVEPERNDALEAERPGDAVFKAIFGSDDEDE